MANLHKTERKLPWLVRDGGLPSDWLGGDWGEILCSHTVKLVWQARHSRNIHSYSRRLRSNFPFATVKQVTI